MKEELRKEMRTFLRKKNFYTTSYENLIKKLENYETKETWEQYQNAMKEFVIYY